MEDDGDGSDTSADSSTDDEATTLQDGESIDVSVGTDGQVTAREESALQRVETVSHLLDDAIEVPGTDFRIGLDPILSVLPVAGDLIAGAFSLYPIVEAVRLDVPRNTLAKMLLLVAVDIAGGSVPVLGTVFDAFWKANEWNHSMLEDHVHQS